MQNRNANRSSKARIHWQQHIEAQTTSGLTQSAYCREHQLNDKYFSLWKRKLGKASSELQLIPVVVKTPPAANKFAVAHHSDMAALKISFPNGVGVDMSVPSESIFVSLLNHLAQLSC